MSEFRMFAAFYSDHELMSEIFRETILFVQWTRGTCDQGTLINGMGAASFEWRVADILHSDLFIDD